MNGRYMYGQLYSMELYINVARTMYGHCMGYVA